MFLVFFAEITHASGINLSNIITIAIHLDAQSVLAFARPTQELINDAG